MRGLALFVHVAFAAALVGSIACSVAVLHPAAGEVEAPHRGRLLAAAGARSRRLARMSAVALVVSGIGLAAARLPSLESLWATLYGRVLAVKLALALAVFGITDFTSGRIFPAIRRSAREGRMGEVHLAQQALVGLGRLNLVLGLAVIALGVWLRAARLP